MNLTKDNLNEIRNLIQSEFDSKQKALMNEVKESIESAIATNQRVLFISNQKPDDKKSRKWDVAQIVIPAILTGLVGLGVWYSQNKLADEITASTQAVSTRYVLTQEYYKERFKVYQRTMEHLVILESSAAAANYGTAGKTNLIAAKNGLDEELAKSGLYFSAPVHEALEGISYSGAQLQLINPKGIGREKDFFDKIIAAKMVIETEVRGDMGPLSAEKKK